MIERGEIPLNLVHYRDQIEELLRMDNIPFAVAE